MTYERPYNWPEFPKDMDSKTFAAFPNHLHVGAPAPDGEVTRLSDGAQVRLSDYWKAKPLIIEFGAVTVPYSGLAAPVLESMAAEYSDFQFAVLYTREPHPGEEYPHHTSMEQKLRHAQAYSQLFHVERPLLVDGLDGPLHHAYGLMPNMAYVINTAGKVVFRSSFMDAPTLLVVLDYLRDGNSPRSAGTQVTPFYAELLGHRDVNIREFLRVLALAGPRAVEEMVPAYEANGRTGDAQATREFLGQFSPNTGKRSDRA